MTKEERTFLFLVLWGIITALGLTVWKHLKISVGLNFGLYLLYLYLDHRDNSKK